LKGALGNLANHRLCEAPKRLFEPIERHEIGVVLAVGKSDVVATRGNSGDALGHSNQIVYAFKVGGHLILLP
jgi:hypothetical protein